MGWLFGWAGAYSRHLEAEIRWLREELRFQRDENGRLNSIVASLKHGMTISAVAPAVPRTVDTTTTGVKAATDEAHEEEFQGVGQFDEEPASRGAV